MCKTCSDGVCTSGCIAGVTPTPRRFRTAFEMEIDVTFADQEAAKAFYIDGTGLNILGSGKDLKKISEEIAHSFHHTPQYFSGTHEAHTCFVEGFGLFIEQPDCSFTLEKSYTKDGGQIRIVYEMELEPTGTTEQSEGEPA